MEMLGNEWDMQELEAWGVDVDFKFKEAEEDDYKIPDVIKTDIKTGDLQKELASGDKMGAKDIKITIEIK